MTTPFGIGDLSAMGLPGGNPLQGAGILETMELVRKAWASFSLPPNMAPTMDPDEVARRVSELKAVEQWLAMNLTMLRGTIQALEIQQGTLAALRAFGAAGPTPAGSADDEPAGSETADNAATDRQPAADGPPAPDALNPVAWWEMLQKQFGEVAAAALAGVPAAIDAATGGGRTPADAAGTEAGAARAGSTTRSRSKAGAAGRKRPTAAAGSAARGTKTAARGKADAAASKRGTRRGSSQG